MTTCSLRRKNQITRNNLLWMILDLGWIVTDLSQAQLQKNPNSTTVLGSWQQNFSVLHAFQRFLHPSIVDTLFTQSLSLLKGGRKELQFFISRDLLIRFFYTKSQTTVT